jgi:hypothetical protein
VKELNFTQHCTVVPVGHGNLDLFLIPRQNAVSNHISCTRSWPGIDCVSADRLCRGYEATQKAVSRARLYISVYSWHNFHRMCNPIWSCQFELTEIFITNMRLFFYFFFCTLRVATSLLDTVHCNSSVVLQFFLPFPCYHFSLSGCIDSHVNISWVEFMPRQ